MDSKVCPEDLRKAIALQTHLEILHNMCHELSHDVNTLIESIDSRLNSEDNAL